MEFSSRIALLGCVIVLAISVQSSLAGTSVSSGKQVSGAANSLPAESERSGWSYPTGYSWSNNAVSFGLPLVLIPLIYFGFLWCVLLFGLSAFHHSPAYHRGLHSGGHGGHGVHGGHGGGHGGHEGHGVSAPSHHRYRRYDEFEDDYTQQRVLSAL